MKTPAFALGLALSLAAAGLHAQPFETPPPPAPPRPLTVAAPVEQRLDNGLRLIVAERHGIPLVTARLVVLAGAERDPAALSGLASMTANLLTRGTRHRSAPQLAAAAETLGGSLEAGAGWNESSVGISVTVPKLDAALALLSEVVREPAFAKEEVERYRAQALDDMKLAFAEPGVIASMVAQRAQFGSGAYGHPAGGTPASLPRIARGDLAALHAAFYRPDNAVLVMAGDVTPEQALAFAKRHFGGWRMPAAKLPPPPVPGGEPWPAGAVVVDMPGAGQAGVSLTVPTVPSASPDRFAAEISNAVLGGGYSSRLNQEIRIQRGLSYGANSRLDLRPQAGVLRVGVQTKNPSAAEVVSLVGAELDRLAQSPVPDAELQARRATLVGNFSRSLETTSGLADQAAALAVDGLPMDDLPQRVARLQAVTPAQVQEYAGRTFAAGKRRIAIAGVAGDFAGQLKGPMVTVPQTALDLDAATPPKGR